MPLPFFDDAFPYLDRLAVPGMLCAFDFDGTLAPIVRDPDWVVMPVPIARRLESLSRHTTVAIITGRSVTDIEPRLGFSPQHIVGNHGLEGMPGHRLLEDVHEKTCLEWESLLAPLLADRKLFDAALRLENKGCSLSLHYREAADRAATEAQLVDLVGRSLPAARMVAGKCVLNLLPSDCIDKGFALERLMLASGAPSALYVGDDVTDEAVFALQREDLLSVRIEASETTAAPFFLHHRLGMVQLLDELLSRLSKSAQL